ncbi:TPA: hypothetical protein VBA67_001421 [Streptococcus agalactiae]|uniref:hypothetical protein n=1 Tax=Streptococcus agalactiae TaxID=1311 RepID=UPI000332DCBE|nr:hypothetical protein [Streptococcus agalactiae]OTG49764.1 hypothetical protein B7934_00685 [Streptococcus agalactiae]CCW39533.1 hypothetical protein MSA_6710 [Streptococcus agalactiae ILRI005]HEO6620730.1 hypothetical protein [Streptococcus agalactiae]HEO6628659.1 hypothetical protein [Streptococcus agalactiae]HEO6630680.1 hypothetical protein [Streptococcus agalactiae]
MNTIELNNKIYAVDSDVILNYLAYRKLVNNVGNYDDAIEMYHNNITAYYAEKETAYSDIKFDDFFEELERIAKLYI